MTCEKMLIQMQDCEELRLLTSCLLMSLYVAQRDTSRALRYFESIPEALLVKDQVTLCHLVMTILSLKAECHLLEG